MNVNSYYLLRPFLPRWLQIWGRRLRAVSRSQNSTRWPIWEAASTRPPGFPGWPNGKRFAVVLTHDVESTRGVARCEKLASLEQQRGLTSSFSFVPLRYQTPESLRNSLTRRGFEILVHGLYHDGKEFRNRKWFEQRRGPMNDYLAQWGTAGFASPSTLHDLSWIAELNIDYSISTPDNDPFEPQGCELGRIFPFWVQSPAVDRGFVELPYTLPQDLTLFVLLQEKTNAIWRQKLDWIAQHGGMALIKTHPDYMAFDSKDRRLDTYPVHHYTDLLDYLLDRYRGEFWLAKPSEMAAFWRELPAVEGDNNITFRETFCHLCRNAHNAGQLHQYRPTVREPIAPGTKVHP